MWEDLVWKWDGRMVYRLLVSLAHKLFRKPETARFWRNCHQKESSGVSCTNPGFETYKRSKPDKWTLKRKES